MTNPSSEQLGMFRRAVHPRGSLRFFDDPNTEDIRGAVGELQFSKDYGYPIDATARPNGDRGIDFVTELGIVDVKTFLKPIHLLVKKSEMPTTRAEIFILALDNLNGTATFLGWEYKVVMAKRPSKAFGYDIINHYKLARYLRPMSEFDSKLAEAKQGTTSAIAVAPVVPVTKTSPRARKGSKRALSATTDDAGYVISGPCRFVPDNKGESDKMVGYWYCVDHKSRTSSARSCQKGSRG